MNCRVHHPIIPYMTSDPQRIVPTSWVCSHQDLFKKRGKTLTSTLPLLLIRLHHARKIWSQERDDGQVTQTDPKPQYQRSSSLGWRNISFGSRAPWICNHISRYVRTVFTSEPSWTSKWCFGTRSRRGPMRSPSSSASFKWYTRCCCTRQKRSTSRTNATGFSRATSIGFVKLWLREDARRIGWTSYTSQAQRRLKRQKDWSSSRNALPCRLLVLCDVQSLWTPLRITSIKYKRTACCLLLQAHGLRLFLKY